MLITPHIRFADRAGGQRKYLLVCFVGVKVNETGGIWGCNKNFRI